MTTFSSGTAFPAGESLARELRDDLTRRILVMDGATGTGLEALRPTTEDFGGDALVGCNEALLLHAPQIVRALHQLYLEAGADILETNTFNGSTIVLAEYGLQDQTYEINRLAGESARAAAAKFAANRRVYVAGSMGPTNKAISITGGITFDEIVRSYALQSAGLLDGGADYLLLETQQDTINLKAALLGCDEAMRKTGRQVPLAVSVTIEANGSMLAGQNIEALYYTLAARDLLYIGMNCATGPEKMTDHLRTLAGLCHLPTACVPNAGLPNTEGKYDEGPEVFHDLFERFCAEQFVNVIGGCCGTSPEHIRALRKVADHHRPRKPQAKATRRALAGSEPLKLDEFIRPAFVGERTNVIGSRKFKRLIEEGKFELAAEIGREQVVRGAHVVDLCAANPDRHELSDMLAVLKPLLRKVRVPVMIDSTDEHVVELALQNIGGKAAINSINFEDGEQRLEKVCPIARKHGAAVVFGLIDEDKQAGMAVTLERKLAIAERAMHTLTQVWGFDPGEIIFDPLVFPCGTGDPNYVGAARATVEGIREIRKRFPEALTILGISNVSFGLPPAGREALNSVFLYDCTLAGLDMAIVNTAGIERYGTLSPEAVAVCENVLYKGDAESIAAFAAFYREAKTAVRADELAHLPVAERLARCIVDGTRDGIELMLDELLKAQSPLEIINGPLMAGMKVVGELFGANKLIVAEVLESAEVMKVAVDYLKQFLKPGERSAARGRMLLATVKGDVHDIGKNLVDMILSNNGYEVVNLGIKIPPDTLIEAVHLHKPDFIGLSGLLVRSAQQMVVTAEDLTSAGIDLPLMVGGAALTRNFTLTRIAPAYTGPVFYANEAMDGLQLANRLTDETLRPGLESEWRTMGEKAIRSVKESAPQLPPAPSQSLYEECPVPPPPDLELHIDLEIPAREVFPLVSRAMLYGKHLGLRLASSRLDDPKDKQAQELRRHVERVFEMAIEEKLIVPRGTWRWFPVASEQETVRVFDPGSTQTLATWTFPRERSAPFRCAADWVRPRRLGGHDYLCLFVTTAGDSVQVKAKALHEQGELLSSHILSALAIEMAEATAEWLHRRIRAGWGFADPPEFTWQDLIRTTYRGIRLSFGYPACPNLEDQVPLFKLLTPEQSIGVSLTDEMMMVPESSVSALVFHHPNGQYFAAQ
ncbi:methionine synthase [candidate division KSB1 bacterium]|nr:methionine synthase [candidate division KSB1 bacterium]